MTMRERIERDGLLAFVESELLACDTIGAFVASERWQAIADSLRGKVLVDEGELMALVQMNDNWMQGHVSCCKSCPLLGKSCMADEGTDCRTALLAHFGLSEDGEK